MTMKDRFDADEWQKLRSLPLQVWGVVAMADKKVDHREAEEMTKRLAAAAAGDPDPLLREVAADLLSGGPPAFERSLRASLDASQTHPEQVKRLLREKLSDSEYQGFFGSLFADAVMLARSGRKRLFKRSGINKNEMEMLRALAGFWEIDLDAAADRFGRGS
jgi:hypothetical protein